MHFLLCFSTYIADKIEFAVSSATGGRWHVHQLQKVV